jgi:putative NIF3 family GTP cyclohydrolase 1 type 2
VDAAPGGLNDWLAGMLDDVTDVSAVKPIAGFTPEGFEGAGYGRLVKLARPYSVGWIAKRYADRLGSLRHVMVARPFKGVNKSNEIRTVAVCAGSGYDVLKDTAADLIVTGEMSHHNALRLTMLGKWVLTVFHSNSERQFLAEVLQPRLQRLLRETEQDAEVLVSREDTDPFVIWDVKDLPDL